jgi:TonB family protein
MAMRVVIVASVSAFGLSAFTAAQSKSIALVDGASRLIVTDAPVQRRCTVVLSSGSYELDQKACDRALASLPAASGGLPKGSYIFPGRDRRYADGSCVLPDGASKLSNLDSLCTALLQSMGKARVTMAIRPDAWVRSSELRGFQASGPVTVSIGISPQGKASYCTIARSSGDANFDQAVCQAILKRARFEPALDELGRPVPSMYARQWS